MKKFLKPRIMIIGLAALVIVCIIGAAVWFFFLKGPESNDSQGNAEGSAQGLQAEAPLETEPAFEEIVSLFPFDRIPLKKSGNISSISMTVALELISPDMRETVEARQNELWQIIEAEIRKMTWIELRNPEGKLKLKFNLIKLINSELAGSMIRDLYFTQFIMQ